MSVKDKTVSVILPTRDRAPWLQKTIRSIVAQSHKPFEIIVIDDGSRDNTQAILATECANAAPQVFHFLQTTGLGVSAARNLGIRMARGAFIALIDSDDQWHPLKLEKQIACLENHPDAALCHTEEIWIRNGKRVNACKHHEKSGGWIFEKCLPRCVISPSASLIRSSIFSEVGMFDETLPVCEDYDLWLRICSRFAVAFVAEALTIKNGGHPDQLSHAYPMMDQYRISALEKILHGKTLTPAQIILVHNMIAEKSKIIATGARKRGNLELAKQYERGRSLGPVTLTWHPEVPGQSDRAK